MAYGFIFDFFLGVMKPIFPVFDALFGFAFSIFGKYTASLVSLGLFSAVVALLISLTYVVLIDREEYNRIRDKQKELQEKMKEAQDNDNMDKVNEYMKESMSMQKKFFKVSLKPIFASMFIFFLVVPWILHTFVPVVELQQADNGFRGNFEFMGAEMGELKVENRSKGHVLVSKGEEYKVNGELALAGTTWEVENIQLAKNSETTAEVKLAFEFVKFPFSIPLIGNSLEWLGFYIITQIPFTIAFRKMLGLQ
ncbi:MAG: EMC3/TMCO1 family protein [Candidatus Nanohaloarchaea archaeon]|nr:EMC3/TMCO1 family protein [Candidatus Nanohaloarchaea archaeon]